MKSVYYLISGITELGCVWHMYLNNDRIGKLMKRSIIIILFLIILPAINVFAKNVKIPEDDIDVNIDYRFNTSIKGIKKISFRIHSFCTGDGVSGFDFAIIVPDTTALRGLQIGGVGARAIYFEGVQISGIHCYSYHFKGAQVCIGVNGAKTCRGLQIGLINSCGVLKGIQIGVVNIAYKSPIPFMIGVNVGW